MSLCDYCGTRLEGQLEVDGDAYHTVHMCRDRLVRQIEEAGAKVRLRAEGGAVSPRTVWRVRDTVTGGWKLRENGMPIDFVSPDQARYAARYLKRWRIVRVAIRESPKVAQARADGAAEERAKIVAWLRSGSICGRRSSWSAERIERAEHEPEDPR